MKNFIVYYRFKGAKYREHPMNISMISDVTKKHAKESFLASMTDNGIDAKVIRIDKVK
jgi:hypothetical protein